MKPPITPRVTIKTVADEAGVSPATVSLILTDRPGWVNQFHPDTVKRVRAVAEKLGYHRNIFASSMPSGASSFFALVLQEMTGNGVEGWPHWAFEGSLLEGVISGAEQRDVHPIVVTTRADPDEAETAKVAGIIDGGVFGSIVRTPGPLLENLLRTRLARGHPLVMVFPRQISAWPTNAIDVDNVAVGQIAGRILAARRRRQWLLVRYQQMTEAHRLRAEGFAQAARQARARVTPIRVGTGADEQKAAATVARQIEQSGAEAIFAVDSVASIGALLGCMRAGAVPGSDCDLVGCDVSLWQTPGLPVITSVDISWRQVGAVAIEKLLRASQGGQPRFKTVLLKPRVTEGDTCPVPARFRPERPEVRAASTRVVLTAV